MWGESRQKYEIVLAMERINIPETIVESTGLDRLYTRDASGWKTASGTAIERSKAQVSDDSVRCDALPAV